MTENILDHLNTKPELMAETAFIITFDEGGGYYDSGYIQPIDFFGDGPRIPLIVVSNFSRGGHISHTYTDHVSSSAREDSWIDVSDGRGKIRFQLATSDDLQRLAPE